MTTFSSFECNSKDLTYSQIFGNYNQKYKKRINSFNKLGKMHFSGIFLEKECERLPEVDNCLAQEDCLSQDCKKFHTDCVIHT